ncbi:MAG: hypothetical protein IJ188_07695, partial [Clostridia bacterium]|nr:hypothetical protein [Clostridia bacterium]
MKKEYQQAEIAATKQNRHNKHLSAVESLTLQVFPINHRTQQIPATIVEPQYSSKMALVLALAMVLAMGTVAFA